MNSLLVKENIKYFFYYQLALSHIPIHHAYHHDEHHEKRNS